MKVYAPFPIENFINIKFKGFRRASLVEDDFTPADLPCMNPYDWISLFLILSKDEQKYEPIIAHLKRMLNCYIHEIGKMDVEIAFVLKKKPILKPKGESKDLHKLKLGKILKDNWSVVYRRKNDQMVQRCMLFLLDKNLHLTSALNNIMGFTEAYKANNVADQKCFLDMLKWYIVVRNTLLNLMLLLFKLLKRQQQ